jgi:hypothetical protein
VGEAWDGAVEVHLNGAAERIKPWERDGDDSRVADDLRARHVWVK